MPKSMDKEYGVRLRVAGPPEGADIDVVAVHGLGGHALRTWQSKEPTNKGQNWIIDAEFLPAALPKARIFTYGYNANLFDDRVTSRVQDHANGLCAGLLTFRRQCKDRPILWIGHSMGGIVIKRTLLSHNEEYITYIRNPSIAIVFLATPHHGSILAEKPWLPVAQKLISWAKLRHDVGPLVGELEPFSNTLRDTTADFSQIASAFEIRSFVEQKPTRLPPPEGDQLIVQPGAAVLGLPNEKVIPLPTTHSGICKFESGDNNYYIISQQIVDVVQVSLEKVNKQSELLQDRRRAITDWLTPLNFPAQHNDLCSRRQEGTGDWFLKDEKFQNWLNGKYPELFCTGIPGAGKTMISSIAIDYIKNRVHKDDISVACIYFTHSLQREQRPIDLFASILKQRVQSEAAVPDSLNKLYDAHLDYGTRPSFDEIFDILPTKEFRNRQVYLVVDALDECLNNGSDGEDELILSKLLTLAESGVFRLMASSRPIPSITNLFSHAPNIEIRASHTDLETFLREHMKKLPMCVRNSPTLQSTIEKKIIDVVDGVFLLASLHIDSLGDKLTVRAVTEALNLLPKGKQALHKAYSGAIDRIQNQMPGIRQLAESVLLWVSCAKRIMTKSELLHALAVIPDEDFLDKDNFQNIDELLSFCAGLVILDRESDKVRLVHQTAEDYLKSVREDRFPCADVDISLTCLAYLSFRAFANGECSDDVSIDTRLQEYPFLAYAAVYWNDHVNKTSDDIIRDMSIRLLQDGARSLAFIQVKHRYSNSRHKKYSRPFEKFPSALHIAVYLQLVQISRYLIAQDIKNLVALDKEGRTPFLWAVWGGSVEVVTLFLEKEANPQDEDDRGCRAIHYAASEGFLSLIQIFTNKVDINRPDKRKQTPLHHAILNLHSAIVKFLLTEGVDLDTSDIDRRSALHHAIRRRDINLVMDLIYAGATATQTDKEKTTPLHEAAKLGLREVLNPLLQHGAEIDAKDKWKRTPLHCAAFAGYSNVVQILLENGADATNIDMNSQTALDLAMEGGHLDVVRVLWEDVEGPSNIDTGPQKYMFRAAGKGDELMVEYWLGQGAIINGVDKPTQRTALHFAAMKGCQSIVPVLLRHGADITLRDWKGWTPVLIAAQQYAEETVSSIVTAGLVDLNLTDYAGSSLLHIVCRHSLVNVAGEILDRGGRHDSQDLRGRTPLHVAAIENNSELVTLLMEKGASDAIKDHDGWRPSDWATWLGYDPLVKILDPSRDDLDFEQRKQLIIARIKIGVAEIERQNHSTKLDDECLLCLGFCAIFLGRRELAKVILTDHSICNPAWTCDGCLKPRKHPRPRSFCTICYDVDVCDVCFRQKSKRICHAPNLFLRIDFSSENGKVPREQWVEELKMLE